MDTKYAQDRINYVITSLEDALLKCISVDFTDDAKMDQSPAYVIGYTSSMIKNALADLKGVANDLN
jgi:hypothetical protein